MLAFLLLPGCGVGFGAYLLASVRDADGWTSNLPASAGAVIFTWDAWLGLQLRRGGDWHRPVVALAALAYLLARRR